MRVLLILLCAVLIVVAGAGWVAWMTHRQWDRLDTAADNFEAPAGFTEVALVRQGTAFCFVSCTNGGEAIVTSVFKTNAKTPEEACRALRPVVTDLAANEVQPWSAGTECGWIGGLGGSATIGGFAGPQSTYGKDGGARWTEKIDAPDSPVVAYVEFNSGVE